MKKYGKSKILAGYAMTNRILSLILLLWVLSLNVLGQIPEGFVFIKGAEYEGGRIHVEDFEM